jgi:hypothetical protein
LNVAALGRTADFHIHLVSVFNISNMSIVRDHHAPPQYGQDGEKLGSEKDGENSLDKQTTLEEGEQKFHKLGWKRLTICLIVEAIALGSLSVPSAFATVGMVAGE